jgi:pyruvate formate lyase activating enzyme
MDITIAGCNYRCPFCPHEKLIYHYIPMKKTIPDELVDMLRPRLGFLDGVSVSGGEPLLHRGLIDLLKELKFNDSKVRIKTNASKPSVIHVLLDKHLVDFFSVFIPAPLDIYKETVNYDIDIDDVISSIHMIRKSGLDHEFKVKPVPGLIGRDEVMEIANFLVGAPRFVIERFAPEKAMDPKYRKTPAFTDSELQELRNSVAPFFNETVIQP